MSDVFAVEFYDEDNDQHGDVLRDADALAQYVKANANDLTVMRIVRIDPGRIAALATNEEFGHEVGAQVVDR